MYKLYRFVAFISVLLRQFVLPNPFEPLGKSIAVTIDNIVITLTPDIVNWITEPILHAVTFSVVGLYYKRGRNDPSLGSFLYLVFYALHVGLIYIVSSFNFSCIVIILILVLYLGLHILINYLKNRFIK